MSPARQTAQLNSIINIKLYRGYYRRTRKEVGALCTGPLYRRRDTRFPVDKVYAERMDFEDAVVSVAQLVE